MLVCVCVCVSGLHRWAAALPALLQSVCAEHTGLSESTNYRLSFPQTGTSAQVNLPSCHTHTRKVKSVSADVTHVYQVSVRTVLCGRDRRCGTSNVPHGKKRSRHTLHIAFQLTSVVDRWVLQVCGAVCVIGSVISVFRV